MTQPTPNNDQKLVGVISDTHGLVRPEAIQSLRGVDMILHAGDIGNLAVLETLRTIAPVIAVRGNNDKGDWAESLPDWEAVEIGAVSIYMLHNVNEMDIRPSAAEFQVIISGHSHRPNVEKRRGILYLNPRSAGPRRFELPVSLAHLNIKGTNVVASLIELSV